MSEITSIKMPQWSMTVTEGKVLCQLKKEGDSYRADEELLEIGTTKITNVFEASRLRMLRPIIAGSGATLLVGALMAVSASPDVPDREIDSFVARFVAPEPAAGDTSAKAVDP